MQFLKSLILLLGFFTGLHLLASPPVPFSGKLAVDGTNFHGNALFSFSIVDQEGSVHWRHAQEQDSTIEIFVLNGRYVALLGGQGMLPLPADLFLKEKSLSLRVSVDLQDGQGMRLLEPDQPITSTPYALAAELARLAEKASVADGVTPGAITADMIDTDLLSDLNRTAGLTEITREMLPQDVLDDLNRTIGIAQLSAEVNEKLNRDFTIQPGSISKSLLGQDVLGDLNRTILRHHLSEELRAELNRTIRLRDLAPEVIADLNDSIAPGSITLDMLASGVRADLNRTISKSMLSQEIKDDLNRTIGLAQLSSEVAGALKPSVVGQPNSLIGVSGTSAYLEVNATGVNLSYQWKKNGADIVGATSRTLYIHDLNASQHEGNYSVVVNNSLGSIISSEAHIDVNGSMTQGLVGWWKFDETDGNLSYDSSGNQNDGNLTNGPTWVEGKIGGALSFDGIDDYMITPNFEGIGGSNPRSITAWIKTTDLNAPICSYGLDQAGEKWTFRVQGDGVLRTEASGGWKVGSTPVINGQWTFVCSILDAGSDNISDVLHYVNGNLDEFSSVQPVSLNTSLSGQLRVGRTVPPTEGSWAGYFAGLIDDLRIYDRALSVDEVKALYASGEGQVGDGGSVTVVSGEVPDGSISLSKLSSEVRADLNRTITKSMLGQDVLADINRTITKAMLSQEVLNELNSSSGGGGVVPGSLLALPRNQSAPSGYELYQRGDEDLVWEEKAPVSVARYAFDGVEVLGGKIYFVGGKDGAGAKNIAERYDPATNTWATLANMSATREGVACAVLNGKLYAIGGVGLTSVEVFNPSNGNWSAGVALPSQVKHGTAITVDGKIFLIGGWNASDQNINQILCFDPSTSQWITKANMPTARHGAKLVWFENRIWAIGGYDGTDTNKVGSYDPATDTWQAEASLTTGRHWPVAWVANGRIYVGGGKTGSSRLNSIEVYDPATKQWTSAGNFPENKYAADAVVLNDKAYVVAGQTAAGVWSNKVFAADLNASVSGVFDLYRKDGNASSGVPVAEVADGSVTASKLSSEVSNALKPVVIGQPSSVVEVGGNTAYLAVDVDGVNLSYQWKKDGVDIAGATNDTLSITDLNASQHEGNYTVVVSNAFGSVTSSVAQIDVNGSLTEGLVGWWKFDETEGNIASDSSGNGNDGNLTNGPTWTEGKIGGALSFDGVDDLFSVNEDFFYGKSFTFSSWVNDTVSKGEITEPENRWIFAHGTTDQNKLLHFGYRRYDAQGLLFGFFSNDLDTEFTASTGWSFLSFTFDYTTKNRKIFGNGNVIGSDISPSNYLGTGNFHLGRVVNSNFITLEIDDLRIYDRAISAVEVKALYELGEQPVQESGSGTTTVVNGTVADGSITTNQLSEQILKYLKPEITQQPTAGTIFADTNGTFSVSAEGKYLTYQWKKNGVNLTGETNATLTIADANATQHDGNYTVVVSNDFGSVESGSVEIRVSALNDGLLAWWPFDGNGLDMSENGRHSTPTNTFSYTSGKINQAIRIVGLNGNTGGHILIPYISNIEGSDFSITLWVKEEQMHYEHGQYYIQLGSFASFGNTQGYTFGNSTDSTIQRNQWNHIAFVFGSSTKIGFLNGAIALSSSWNRPTSSSFTNSAIGKHWWENGQESATRLTGQFDDVRIYDRALSAEEVQALYQLGQ